MSFQLQFHPYIKRWYQLDEIPWEQIAFANTSQAIKLYQQYLKEPNDKFN